MATTPEEIREALRAKQVGRGRNRQRRQGGLGNTQQAFTANPTGSQVADDVRQTSFDQSNTNVPLGSTPESAPTTTGSVGLNIPEPTEIGTGSNNLSPGTLSNGGDTVSFTAPNGGTATVSGDNVASRLGDGGGTVSSFDSNTFFNSASAERQQQADLAEIRNAARLGFSNVEDFRNEVSGRNARAQQSRIDLGEQRTLARQSGREQADLIQSRISELQDRDRSRGFATSSSNSNITKLIQEQADALGQGAKAVDQVNQTFNQNQQASSSLREQQRQANISAQTSVLDQQSDALEAQGKRSDSQAIAGQKASLAERRFELQQTQAVSKALDDTSGQSIQQRVANAVAAGGVEKTISALPEASSAIADFNKTDKSPQAKAALLNKLTSLGLPEAELIRLSSG